jgi:hypothetical protein
MSEVVINLMGYLNRSENSLNQHIKNKHFNEWTNKKQKKININIAEQEEEKIHFLEKSNEDVNHHDFEHEEKKYNDINFSDI